MDNPTLIGGSNLDAIKEYGLEPKMPYNPGKEKMDWARKFLSTHKGWYYSVWLWYHEKQKDQISMCPADQFYNALCTFIVPDDEELIPLFRAVPGDCEFTRRVDFRKRDRIYCDFCLELFPTYGYGRCPCCNAGQKESVFNQFDVQHVVGLLLATADVEMPGDLFISLGKVVSDGPK